jgi:hypothetical protein
MNALPATGTGLFTEIRQRGNRGRTTIFALAKGSVPSAPQLRAGGH